MKKPKLNASKKRIALTILQERRQRMRRNDLLTTARIDYTYP